MHGFPFQPTGVSGQARKGRQERNLSGTVVWHWRFREHFVFPEKLFDLAFGFELLSSKTHHSKKQRCDATSTVMRGTKLGSPMLR